MENNVKTGNSFTNAIGAVVKVAAAGMLLGFGAAVANRTYRTFKDGLDMCDEYIKTKGLEAYLKFKNRKGEIRE